MSPSVDLQSPPALLADAGVGGEGGVEEGGEEESDDCRRHREGSEASEERGTRRTFIPVTSRQALESSSKKYLITEKYSYEMVNTTKNNFFRGINDFSAVMAYVTIYE